LNQQLGHSQYDHATNRGLNRNNILSLQQQSEIMMGGGTNNMLAIGSQDAGAGNLQQQLLSLQNQAGLAAATTSASSGMQPDAGAPLPVASNQFLPGSQQAMQAQLAAFRQFSAQNPMMAQAFGMQQLLFQQNPGGGLPSFAQAGNPAASSFNQGLQHSLRGAGAADMEPTALPENPMLTGRKPVALFMPCDVDSLSEYQCLVRRQIELFEAHRGEVESNAKGRNKPIIFGQVGIRCRHCSMLTPKHRSRGAMYYPAKLNGLYQAAQSMASGHLCYHCQHIPQDIRQALLILRERKSSAGGGKKYWGDGVRVIGVFEDDDGLRFKKR
jgi:hypothetical protein